MLFQSSHSRNGYAWSASTDETGRVVLSANGKGVRRVCGLIVTALGRYQHLTKRTAAEYLQKHFHESFTVNDMSSVFSQLVKAEIATNTRGVYSLTKHGAKLWRESDKDWV